MGKILGLDIGSNSIGWALVDTDRCTVRAAGVRVFPEGVDRKPNGSEESNNAQRRNARAMRRQIARRARRRRNLESLLAEMGFWTKDPVERNTSLLLNPYQLRAEGLDRQLNPLEFGRALIHLNHRRGFLSNRRTDKATEKETSEMKAAISQLDQEIRSSGCRTLGEYFYRQNQGESRAKVRGRHTRRSMYLEEFEALWAHQASFYPERLTPDLKARVHKTIFFQRKMYWKESSIGNCSLIPGKKRASAGDRVVQKFRVYQEVNNLLVRPLMGQERPLTPDERSKLIAYLFAAKERTFDQIRNHLGLENHSFNLERGERDKLLGLPIDDQLSKIFGKTWRARPDAEKTAIVREMIGFAQNGTDDQENDWVEKAIKEWNLPDTEVARDRFLAFDPPGRASFCLEAIERLLPHLEAGLHLMTNDATPGALSAAGFLRPDQKTIHQKEFLPTPPAEITNPIVRHALHQVRKLVNAVIRELGKPDAIHIELARESKGSAKQRQNYIKTIHDRRRKRETAAKEIEDHGVRPTRGALERYLLWKEQNGFCIYSGRPISMGQLLAGEVDVDHIWPYNRSLDDSLGNKVLCFREENAAKGNRTPMEWLGANQEKLEQVLERVKDLPFPARQGKLARFQQAEVMLEDFISRQLNDTSFICRQVADYVRCLGLDVVPCRGGLTAELRHFWGLNTILAPDAEPEKKVRIDHRHHAIDAIVIALLNRSRLQRLAHRASGEILDPPWENFREELVEKIPKILVSHKVRHQVRGQLHDDTFYGRARKPEKETGNPRPWAIHFQDGDETKFAYRKPLVSLTLPEVEKIRDPRIKELVIARLAQFGIKPADKGKIPETVWQEPLRVTARKNSQGTGAVIQSVRLLKEDQTILPLRDGKACVKPGNTHHIALFEMTDGRGRKRRLMESVTMLEAYQRKRAGLPIVKRFHATEPGARFLFSLIKGDLVWAMIDGKEQLLKYETSASTQGQIYFAHHWDARPSSSREKIAKKANTLHARKVHIDLLGRIRWSHD